MPRLGDYEKPIERNGFRYWAFPDMKRRDGSVSKYPQSWGWTVVLPDGRVRSDLGCGTRRQALEIGARHAEARV